MSFCTRVIAAFVFVCGLAPAITHAQDYPNRPIRLLVGFPPGSSADITAPSATA
jgi:tripartite-type tricarboxylate transporter receptor subunit TctC